MRRPDDTPFDPELAAALDAIDATLAGDPVDPDHAELAELAVLLADERPRPRPAFAATLDGRVEQRFARAPHRPPRRAWVGGRRPGWRHASWSRSCCWPPAGPGRPPATCRSRASRPVAASSGAAAPASAAPASAASSRIAAPASTASSQSATAAAASPRVTPLQPTPNGRKTIQAAQLSLIAPAGRVDNVAQEVFDVVGRQQGIVSSSSATAGGAGGYAEFQLSVPSASLGQTMAALSTLPYAHVSSRTDTTQDVNDRYLADVRRLADARALRTSLLKQLANAEHPVAD